MSESNMGPSIEKRLEAREGTVRGLLRALERIANGEWTAEHAKMAVKHYTCNHIDHLFVEMKASHAFTEQEIVAKFEKAITHHRPAYVGDANGKAIFDRKLYQVTENQLLQFVKDLNEQKVLPV